MRKTLVATMAAALIAVGCGDSPEERRVSSTPDSGYGYITRVVDGDTIYVGQKQVRLLGIDAPEVFLGAECGGRQASAWAKYHFQGRRVRLRTDPTQLPYDRYGRLLAYVDLVGEGGSMNAAMVRAGWAEIYVYNDAPFQRVRGFRQIQADAQRAKSGIWKQCS